MNVDMIIAKLICKAKSKKMVALQTKPESTHYTSILGESLIDIEPEYGQQTREPPTQAGNGKLFAEYEAQTSTFLTIIPVAERMMSRQPWVGEMWIKCDDVPMLMREGLNITSANLVLEEGYIDLHQGPEEFRVQPDWHLTRHFYLRDVEQEPPRWVAILQAHSDSLTTLRGIRLDTISFRNVNSAYAYGVSGKSVYQYTRWAPDEAFNAIYDDMPLEGWWPWPRREPPNTNQPTFEVLHGPHKIFRLNPKRGIS
ncbi:hypothetical protein SUNI508_09699 [Seiridium unicorne]|uniref:Uncharacterized protein n=1 Tax=Seiridium unicorne TaxID=138068 RepID=A0ABR2UQ15_9PEZI